MKFLFDRILLPFAAPLLVLIIWELIAIELKNDVVLPTVGQVWVLFLHPNEDLLRLGSLLQNLGMSSIRVLCGYSAGLVLALPLGILMGHYKKVNRFMTPLVEILRPMPPLAWIPLILAWFGVASFATMLGIEEGEWYVFFNNIKFSMLIIIFIGAFFPILLNTVYGVSSVRSTLIDSARVLGASERDIFTKILLPAAAPSIVTGMRLGLGVAWMCLVAAEMMPGSISGIGYVITHAYTVARTDIVIAGMVSIGAVGLALDAAFRYFEGRCFDGGGRLEAISDASIAINDKEFVCLLGPSGCGKSTWLRIVAGLESATAGKVLYKGAPVTGPGKERGMVFQEYSLLPWRTVADNVSLGPEFAGMDAKSRRDIAMDYLARVGLEKFADAKPHELSGGMRQRAAIARALANNPEVLLMDEPFGALDAHTRVLLQRELLRIWEQDRKTVVFVTHSVDEALYLADRIVVMTAHPGRVLEEIDVPFERPRSRATKGYGEMAERILELLEQNEK